MTEALGASHQDDISNTHVDLLWKRSSTQRGADEDIVYEFGIRLDIPDGTWEILWEFSEY